MTKQEILKYIFKSKDGASWNEVSEMLNEYEHDKVQLFMNWLYEIWYRKRYMTPPMLVDLYFEETQPKFNSEPIPSDEFKHFNHHHELTEKHDIVDFGDGEFVANKMAIPLLKALNELGLRTRTHHADENGGFVSILIENGIRAEIKEVNELDADRTKYNGKTELLISWDSKLPDKAKAGGQKTLKTVEQHEPRLNEPEQACFISHVVKSVCPDCGQQKDEDCKYCSGCNRIHSV